MLCFWETYGQQVIKKIYIFFCSLPEKLLTNGDSSSREFVDPPGEFDLCLLFSLLMYLLKFVVVPLWD